VEGVCGPARGRSPPSSLRSAGSNPYADPYVTMPTATSTSRLTLDRRSHQVYLFWSLFTSAR
jgi:hypothetical protein